MSLAETLNNSDAKSEMSRKKIERLLYHLYFGNIVLEVLS